MANRKAAISRVGHGSEAPGLNQVDREIIGALTDLRDALRARTPLERSKYTVRQVVVVLPPPQIGPDDVRKTRELLGLSQPVFADFLGTSASTIRSWEQGQKVPSPMARRLLGLIASDPPYWQSRFWAMVEARTAEPGAQEVVRPHSDHARDLPGKIAQHRKDGPTGKGFKRKAGSNRTS
jgi:putative transcriptional regulator